MTQLVLQLVSVYSLIYGVDPNLALAVASHESKMNTQAVGALGELGLMQLRPEYFAESCKLPQSHKEPCGRELLKPEVNLQIGIKNLAELQKTCRHKKDGTYVICHNLGLSGAAKIKHPKQQSYYKLVMVEYDKIKSQNYFGTKIITNKLASNP